MQEAITFTLLQDSKPMDDVYVDEQVADVLFPENISYGDERYSTGNVSSSYVPEGGMCTQVFSRRVLFTIAFGVVLFTVIATENNIAMWTGWSRNRTILSRVIGLLIITEMLHRALASKE